MASRKTCDKCRHYTPTDMPQSEVYVYAGSCNLIGDANDKTPAVEIDKIAAYDYDSYKAGAHVGPKFGCIHWVKKQA